MSYQNVVCSDVSVAYKTKAVLGECPRWDEKNKVLYWVDIDQNRFHQFNPVTGDNKTVTFDEKIGCFALRETGGFVVGLASGVGLLNDFNTNVTPLCDPESDKNDNRFNDGRCDPIGRFVTGTVNMVKSAQDAGVYQVSADEPNVANRLADNLYTANGIAFSLCGRTMYYSDTPNHVLYRGDYDVVNGTISNVSIFREFEIGNGRPDGASVDSESYYWSALYEGHQVVRISPEGEIVERVQIPAKHCTMITFGGDDMKTVYVTTASSNMTDAEHEQYPDAGSIFTFKTSVAGVPEKRFKG